MLYKLINYLQNNIELIWLLGLQGIVLMANIWTSKNSSRNHTYLWESWYLMIVQRPGFHVLWNKFVAAFICTVMAFIWMQFVQEKLFLFYFV